MHTSFRLLLIFDDIEVRYHGRASTVLYLGTALYMTTGTALIPRFRGTKFSTKFSNLLPYLLPYSTSAKRFVALIIKFSTTR
eukprot:SAG11_NODE_153_length_14352_cov_24.348323_6_plen_82_part_00